MRVGLFVPCFVDQFVPRAAIAALEVLERLGLEVSVPEGAACCGQPPANAGAEGAGLPALAAFATAFAQHEHIVVLSGSCTAHIGAHAHALGDDGGRLAERTHEFCGFLHDVIGVERVRTLGARCESRVAVHIGCHALRGVGLATPSELQRTSADKVRAILQVVEGLSMAPLERPDECCGFGGSFSVAEWAVSTRMGEDRLADVERSGAQAIVSTDLSCLLHLGGVDRARGGDLAMWHVAEVLAGIAPTPSAARGA